MATKDYKSPYSGQQVDKVVEAGLSGLYASYSFKTVNDLKAGITSSGVVVVMSDLIGETVETIGYHVAGDGGGSTGQVTSGAFVENGGSQIGLGVNLYFYAYPYYKKDQAYDLRQFGAYGDNVNPDDTQIQNALNTKLPIQGSNMHCKLVNSTRLYQYNFIYAKNLIFDLSSTGNHNYQPVLFASAAVKSTAVVGNVVKDQTKVLYTGAAEVGDLVVISNDEPAFDSNPAEGIKKGEAFLIISISATEIELHNSVWLNLDAATVTVYEKLTVGVIGSLKLIGNGFSLTNIGGNETGLRYEHCINNVVRGGYETIDIDHHGIHTDSCFNSDISGFNIVQDQPIDPQAVQNAGQVVYGIAIFNCETESRIHDGRVNGGKHPIDWTQNNTFAGYSKNVHVYNNTLTACWHSAIGTHDAQTLCFVTANVMEDCARGIEFRTPNMTARNNSVKSSRLRGVSLGEGINLTEDCSGCVIDANDVDAKTFGIRVDGAALQMEGLQITNNKLNDLNGASSGMRIDGVLKDSNISGNVAIGTAFGIRTLIDINQPMIGGLISNNSSTGNVINGSGNGTVLSGNHRVGAGFCINWVSAVGEDCMVTNNKSFSGIPVAYIGGYHRGNYSTTSNNASVRFVESTYYAIDVFDTNVLIINPAEFPQIDRIFTQIQDSIFTITLSSGSITINDNNADDNGIVTTTGSSFTLNAGEALVVARTYNPVTLGTRFRQIATA